MGAKINVLVNPPMMTVARGRWTSDPIPDEMAAGTNPTMATIRMERIARSCSEDANATISFRSPWPSSMRLIADTNNTPAITEIPKIETKPTPAETLK